MGAAGTSLAARVGVALAQANARYWTGVAPLVRGELRGWERRAAKIEDSALRALALDKLRGEGFNAHAAAILATGARRSRRREAVRAMVALQLLYDYLDGLTELPREDPLGAGERLFEAYVDALGPSPPGRKRPDREPSAWEPRCADGGYLEDLSGAVSATLAQLPSAGAIAPVAQASARRAAQAQIRMHAAEQLGTDQLEQWARVAAEDPPFGAPAPGPEGRRSDGGAVATAVATAVDWREALAGAASSVLAMHALIAAATDPGTTVADAEAIERGYAYACVLVTLLDGVVDHDRDRRAQHDQPPGPLGYVDLYPDRGQLVQTLRDAAELAVSRTAELCNGGRHAMIATGVVAYYVTAPGAGGELAAPIARRLRSQLAPAIWPSLAVMRCWRAAREWRRGSEGRADD